MIKASIREKTSATDASAIIMIFASPGIKKPITEHVRNIIHAVNNGLFAKILDRANLCTTTIKKLLTKNILSCNIVRVIKELGGSLNFFKLFQTWIILV